MKQSSDGVLLRQCGRFTVWSLHLVGFAAMIAVLYSEPPLGSDSPGASQVSGSGHPEPGISNSNSGALISVADGQDGAGLHGQRADSAAVFENELCSSGESGSHMATESAGSDGFISVEESSLVRHEAINPGSGYLMAATSYREADSSDGQLIVRLIDCSQRSGSVSIKSQVLGSLGEQIASGRWDHHEFRYPDTISHVVNWPLVSRATRVQLELKGESIEAGRIEIVLDEWARPVDTEWSAKGLQFSLNQIIR